MTTKKKNNNNAWKYILGVIAGVAAFLIIFFLVTSGQEQVVTYQYTSEDGMTIEMTYYAKEDRVYKQTANNIFPYSALGVSSAAEAEELFGDSLTINNNIEGYSDEIKYEKDAIIETVTVDYNVVDIDELRNLPGAYFGEGAADNGISLKKSIEWLESQGFKKVNK